NSKDHAVAAPSSDVHAGNDLGDRATPLSGTQLTDWLDHPPIDVTIESFDSLGLAAGISPADR
ncbi:hypothetical protein ACFWQC_25375, partial [Nocardioides sp. NPDC058538]|uniref:hypothetical protein n=1 Tax=Nocardioides sp. NPDC058538 TaxID=3346542 RepID=UPI003665D7E2